MFDDIFLNNPSLVNYEGVNCLDVYEGSVVLSLSFTFNFELERSNRPERFV